PVFVRPLLYFFTYKAFAVNPIFYRLGNVLFHVGTVLALYLFLFLLFNLEIAFLAAILFAVHPVLTESITWISGGIYVVYSFFIIFSLLFYLLAKGKTTVPDKICFEKIKTLSLPANLFKNKFYNLSLVSFFLALASSEKAMVLPFLLFLLEISFFKIKKNWRKLILPFLIGATWILFYAIKIPQRRADLSYTKEAGIYNPLLQLPMSISSYLELIFFPKNLTFYHSELNINYFEYAVMLSIIITLIILIFISFKKNKALFFCLSFFIIALLPVLTPFGISWIVAERYLYLASIGMISAFVLFVYYLTNLKKFKKFKEALYLFFALTVFLLSARTILRNQDWQNQDKLWLATAKLSPSSPQNRNNLGDYYGRQGDFERSIFEFKMAIKLAPNYAAAYHNLANTYLEIGEFDLAIENYYQSLKLDPNFWQTYKSLARAYFRQGKYDLAEQHLLKAIEFDPENPDLPKDLLFLRQQKQEASKLEEKSK
ncbi:MAG: tetratricopeptide repeat protein, partial [Candidatus Woesebacteria bacterium]